MTERSLASVASDRLPPWTTRVRPLREPSHWGKDITDEPFLLVSSR